MISLIISNLFAMFKFKKKILFKFAVNFMQMRIYFVLLIFIFSCSTKKDILFIQDHDNIENFDFSYDEIKIKTDDILRVQISSQSPELTIPFNTNIETRNGTLVSYQMTGYAVNSEGLINLPQVGPVKVGGLTRQEATVLIQNTLIDVGILTNPAVDVKIVNSYFTILGEVNKPGRYNFIKNNINILEAIGIGGDLTINGERKNIKVLRKLDDSIKFSTIDLTNTQFLINDDFQIFPGDIIIVDPNNSRVKNAGIIGNAGNLLSVLSFILSSIILITSN